MRVASLFFVFGSMALWAQSTGASLSGTVVDAQGAAMPTATVTATHVATGARVTATTNSAGFYSLRPLAIGKYTVTIEGAGFRRERYNDVELTTGQPGELNAKLEVGATSESVTVSERPSLLDTRRSEGSQLIEAKTIEDMPLGDRRAMNLIEITGAAVFVNYESGAKPNFSLAGGRTQSQMFLIDGGSGQNMRLGMGQIEERRQVPIQQYHLSEGCSWNRGTHTVKFGGEVRQSMNYEIFRPYALGRYTFDRGFSAAINNQAFSGNGVATLLLGIPGTVEVRETEVLDRRSVYLAGYFQDD